MFIWGYQEHTSFYTKSLVKHIDKLHNIMLKTLSLTVDLISNLRALDPFSNNTSLSNIANGISAHEGVTADTAREIGENILSTMVGESG